VVEALLYKPEGLGLNALWGFGDFSFFSIVCQEYLLRIKTSSA